jgi:hypothetical protein
MILYSGRFIPAFLPAYRQRAEAAAYGGFEFADECVAAQRPAAVSASAKGGDLPVILRTDQCVAPAAALHEALP